MLVQLPRGSDDPPKVQGAEECSAFEAALRRDLASAPVISYDSVLGGWSKRAGDLALVLISAPLWAPVMLGAALWAKLRHPAPVFVAEERIGYGGAAFRCRTLRLKPPSAVIERLPLPGIEGVQAGANMQTIAAQAEGGGAKWRRVMERLPRLLNVLSGDMALVGPGPLSREEIDALKSGKRHYLSARPGVVGVSPMAEADAEESSMYKAYALAWSHGLDALLFWDGLKSLRNQGALWRPQAARPRRTKPNEALARRRAQAQG